MSLRTRLAIFLALSIILAVVAQSVLGFLEFRRVIYKDLDGDLGQFMGLVTTRIESIDELETLDSSYENYVTRVRILDGSRIVAESGGAFPNANGSIGAQPRSHQGWRFESLDLPGLGMNFRLEGAINSKDYERSLEDYRRTAILTALIFSILGAALAVFLSTGALRPLNHLLETITQVSDSGDLSLRVQGGGHRELTRLSTGFNRMLERLQAYRLRETEFTRHASHELRTPLTAIGLEVSSYREGLCNAEDALNAIEREAGRMKRLSEALLLLAREDQPEMRTINLSQIAQTCAARANAKCYGLARLEIQGNAALIERALENLLENANKYAPNTPVSLQLELERNPGFLTLSVADQGPGMSSEALEHATEIFYRAPGTSAAGSGVGLSVIKRIMEAHGGQISLENLQPHGLQVRLEFPLQP